MPPMSAPAKVFGSAMLIGETGAAVELGLEPGGRSAAAIVSRNEANSATAAMTAEPMAKPLVTALVVLPTVSRPSRIVSVSPSNSPDISAMPCGVVGDRAEGVLGHDDGRWWTACRCR